MKYKSLLLAIVIVAAALAPIMAMGTLAAPLLSDPLNDRVTSIYHYAGNQGHELDAGRGDYGTVAGETLSPTMLTTTIAAQTDDSGFEFQLDTALPIDSVCWTSNANSGDYPRGYAIYYSDDGVTWFSAGSITGATGTNCFSSFLSSATQYIRVGSTGAFQWSDIGEVLIDGPVNTPTPPAQDDLSWIEDGNFDVSGADPSTPWDWEHAKPRTSGGSANLLSGVNAYCGNTMAEVRPNYEKFYPNESPGDYYHITGDPPVWNSISSLHQRFYWPGGTAYFQARFMPSFITGASMRVTIVRVENIFGPPLTWRPVDGFIFDSGNMPTWHLAQSTFSLSPGWYDIDFFETGYEDVLVSDYPIPEGDYQAAYLVDDVTLSLNAYTTYCAVEGGPTRTPFPTGTRTPTPTRTLTPTSGASPTPSATATGKPAAFGNCGFESGSTNWTGSGFSVQLAGGPVGPQYGQTTNTLRQNFTWPGGYAFFTFWVGPNSNGTVRVRNTTTQSSITLASVASPSTWQLRTYATQLAAGNYAFEAVALGVMKIDGAMVASNTYYYCGSGSSPATPTSGPTSYVTPTATRTSQYTNTPTRTPTHTPSRTPFATGTAQPSATPRPTNTQPNTNTPQATNTQNAPEQTATAQGTDVPTFTPNPTFTPYPTYTPYPSATPYDAPPEQPEPNFYADCIRPQNADPGAWTEYTTCYALSWFVWSDINTQQVVDFRATAEAKEPFGTMNEIGGTFGDFRDLWNSYDWNDTGIAGTDEDANTEIFTQSASGILLGQLDLNNTPNPYSLTCNLRLDDVMGPNVTVAVCFVWGMLKATGFLAWLQLLWDVLMVWLFIRYIQKAWIAKATMG